VAAVAVWTVAVALLALLVTGVLHEHRHGYSWYCDELWWVVLVAGAGCVLYTISALRALHDTSPPDR
jgi:hypothetical protein